MNEEQLQYLLEDLNEVVYDLENVSYGSDESKTDMEWIAFKLFKIKQDVEQRLMQVKEG